MRAESGRAVLATAVAIALARKRKPEYPPLPLLQPYQTCPPGNWSKWLMMGGRFSGKTFTGSWQVNDHLRKHGSNAWVVIMAPTRADVRETCLVGPSGLYTLYGDEFTDFNKTELKLRHRGGGQVLCFGAESPDRLRGPHSTFLWVDEFAACPAESVDNAFFGLTLGDDPRAILTTTPKPRAMVKDMLKKPGVVLTRMTTGDNKFVGERALAELTARYGGTRLGRQELMGELIEDVEGALWERPWIEDNRVTTAPQLTRIVVAIDPAVTANAGSDETGIAVAGLGEDGHSYMLFCDGFRLSPRGWAARAIDLFHQFEADAILAETNNGGDMVEGTIRQVWADAPFRKIQATRGKTLRAEPISALYEQGKVHHVGVFSALEDQLCSFPVSCEHDDQLDAAVYAVTDLLEDNGVMEVLCV